MSKQTKILIIYTGGTIGMVEDKETGALYPFDFEALTQQIPEIKKFKFEIDSFSFDPLLDSSNMTTQDWIKIAEVIEMNYEKYDGFVVLHGSDTMSYTASALSFMLENLNKPVIFTGSQLPIGVLRTDGKENFITAIEIAAANINGRPIVPEVAIYFENQLFRGNRTHKFNAENFEAFQSINYPVLAEAGVHIKYNSTAILPFPKKKFTVYKEMNTSIAVLKLFPGIQKEVVESIISIKGLKAIVLETFGSGNAPNVPWFLDLVRTAIKNGIIIYNVTQCRGGSVEIGRYDTSIDMGKIGVVGGFDITIESAIAKLMFLLGKNYTKKQIWKLLQTSIRGELTVA
ncbi:MAG: type I asparaginase [Bacteroidetes bacterium]|nr:type I asparaginase [Bacteroidota bacterium]